MRKDQNPKLKESWRLKGWYAWLVGLIVLFTAGLGMYAGIAGMWQ